MLKKVLSLLLAVMLLSTLCVFAETKTAVRSTVVSDEAVIDEANPDAFSTVVRKSSYSYLKGGTDNEDGENLDPDIRVVLHKFDISKLAEPIQSVKLKYVFRDSAPENGLKWGDGEVMVFHVPVDWDSKTVTWNTFNATPFDFTKESANYVANGNGAASNSANSTGTIDITDIVVAAKEAGDTEIAFAYARDVKRGEDGIVANRKNELRMITGASKIVVENTYEIPEYNTAGTSDAILYSDRTLIAPNFLESVPPFSKNWGFYYEQNSTAIGITNDSNATEPYGVSRTNYIKFDLSSIDTTKTIKKATVQYGVTANNGYWSVYHYVVDNDNWKGAHGTGTEESELLWGDAFVTDAETGEVTGNTYAPNKEKYTFHAVAEDLTGGIKKTASDNNAEANEAFDITSIIKGEVEADDFDGTISLAVMVKDCFKADGKEATTRGNVRIVFNSGTSGVMNYAKYNKAITGPWLNIEYEEEKAEFSEVEFKAGESEILTEGSFVLSAKTDVTSNLAKDLNATLLMCVYEGDVLKGIYKTTAPVYGRFTNGGISEISVTSDEAVEITENTKVKVMLWNGIMFQNPIAASKEITPAQ